MRHAQTLKVRITALPPFTRASYRVRAALSPGAIPPGPGGGRYMQGVDAVRVGARASIEAPWPRLPASWLPGPARARVRATGAAESTHCDSYGHGYGSSYNSCFL